MGMPLFAFAANDLTIREYMTAREYSYGESPTLAIKFSSTSNLPTEVKLSGQLIGGDSVLLLNFTDDIVVSANASTTRTYPFTFPTWKAGNYTVVITMTYDMGDVTDVRRVTFTLRPDMMPYWVFGGAGVGVLLGLILIIYGRRRHL